MRSKRKKKKNIDSQIQEKAISWFWVILFISAVFYLRWLLVEMHLETNRLAEQHQRFKVELEEEREKTREFYQEFYADVNETIQKTIDGVYRGEILNKYLNP